MTALTLKNEIKSCISYIAFRYHDKNCGIDPFSTTNIDIWCGDQWINTKSIDEVMTVPFFDGKSLTEIVEEIEIED